MSFSRPLFPTFGGGGQGSTGPTGNIGPQGDAGGNGGTPFYLNYSDIVSGSISLLSQTQDPSGQTIGYTGTSPQQFQTNLAGPYPKTVPGGLYSLYLYAYSTVTGTFDISFNLSNSSTSTVIAVSGLTPVVPILSPPFPTIITAVGSGFTLLNTNEQILLTITITGTSGTCYINYQ
jgi:hypothetical protein